MTTRPGILILLFVWALATAPLFARSEPESKAPVVAEKKNCSDTWYAVIVCRDRYNAPGECRFVINNTCRQHPRDTDRRRP